MAGKLSVNRQRAVNWLAVQDNEKGPTQLRDELEKATGIVYSVSNIQLIRSDMKSGKSKPDTPNPFSAAVPAGLSVTPKKEPPKMAEKTPIPAAAEPTSTPPADKGVSGADPVISSWLGNAKIINEAAKQVGGIGKLIEVAEQMKASGLFTAPN